MTAFVAKVDNAPLPADTGAAAVRSLSALRARGAAVDARSGAHWIAAVTKNSTQAHASSLDGGFALVQGTPRVVGDAELAAMARDRGLAAACAAQYARGGTAFLSRLQGPFALAIRLDRENKTLLAVDRLGVFSLYYMATDAALAFANQLALLRSVLGEPQVDPQAIYSYLYFHVIPGPRTVFKGVHRLPPAGFLERHDGRDSSGRHWQPRFERETGSIDFAATKQEFVELLKKSVREELADAKNVGCFLSGGTDSSTLAGMVSAVGTEPARTYSIGFDQRGFDEIEYSRIAVRHFRTRHKERYVDARDILRIVPRLAEIYGQPFGNSSVVPTFCCAEMAQADGVTTMIGGDGGDELFGGNTRYATQLLFGYYENVPRTVRQFVLEPLVKLPGVSAVTPVRKLGRYIEQALVPMPDRLQTYNHLKLMDRRSMFEPGFIAMVDLEEPERSSAAEYRRSDARTLVNKMLALDWKYTLADNDLPKVTEMCAAAGTDAVFPFLHDEVVAFSMRLPATQKVNRLRLRYFFKKALGDFLPQEIIRKKKHGFGMPFGDWLVAPGPLRDLAFDSLGTLKQRGIFRAEFVEDLCGTRLQQHPNYYGGLIWLLLVLELWLQWNYAPRDAAVAAS